MALPNLVQIKQALDAMMPELSPVPIGSIAYAHEVPTGWLECNGAAVSRTKYARLFKKIGTKYGAGDGSTTFNLPNLHHRVLEATTTTSEVAKMVEAGLPDINGTLVFRRALGNVVNDVQGSGFVASVKHLDNGFHHLQMKDQSYYGGVTVALSAKNANALFGKSSTFQTDSLRMLAIIKI